MMNKEAAYFKNNQHNKLNSNSNLLVCPSNKNKIQDVKSEKLITIF